MKIINDFLPTNIDEMNKRGWDQLDFLYISGDAYVDHPSFGHAIITRVLEDLGFKVGIIPQPRWDSIDDVIKMGRPKYAVIISSGNIDSMVNHYTANKKPRSEDAYSPGGKAGMRPNRAVIVYSNIVKRAFKNIPVIIGGIEASLRRFAHYDYWSNKVRRSVLVDSKADLLIYGMGERAIKEIAMLLKKDVPIWSITSVKGTCYMSDSKPDGDFVYIDDYDQIKNNKNQYLKTTMMSFNEQDPIRGKTIVQSYFDKYLIQNTPQMPLTVEEMDHVYGLFYMRNYHPMYQNDGGVPAIQEVQFSLTSSRGCFGSCTFCALTFHQGKMISKRSHESIINEAKIIMKIDGFKGYIHDVGGPTANFRNNPCDKICSHGSCINKECLSPGKCGNLNVDHSDYRLLLKKLREIEGIKKVFVRSGIRYDYVVYDKDDLFLKDLVKHHVSGQLKTAPEHVSSKVLNLMGKPDISVYNIFADKFQKYNDIYNMDQYIVPYFISSFPGSELKDAIELAEYLNKIKYYPRQIQDFYPTPGTIASGMYYTQTDPANGNKIHVPKSENERKMHRALIQFKNPKNYDLVYKALMIENRKDLIGFDDKCLIKPRNVVKGSSRNNKNIINSKNDKASGNKRSKYKKNNKRGKRI